MEQRAFDLRGYLIPLRKWWWLIVAASVVATLGSFWATRQQAPIYRTRVTVMVGSAIENPNPNGNEFWLTQQLATTYADIVMRDPVRNGVMAKLSLTWMPEYSARVVPSTQLVELTVTDTDPQRAQAVANELANQLILISPTAPGREDQQRQQFISQQLSDLETNIQATQDEIDRKQAGLATLFSAAQIEDTRAQIASMENKLATLQYNYAALLANTQQGALNSINIIEPAALPSAPVGPNKLATILLATAIGLVLATAAAYLLEYLDDTLKNPEDVQKITGLTTLGAVPQIGNLAPGNELTSLGSGQSVAAEAYRILRTNLQFAGVDRALRTLMISSPAPSEGKSLTVSNLGAAFAQTGQRVILVDADLHRPRLHRVFDLRNNVGLTTALLETQPTAEGLLQETSVPGLQVLTSGPLPPNPAELLGSARMRELMQALLASADIVIFDTPPVTALSDAAIMGSQVDGVLMVIGAGTTRREVARRALSALERVNAHVIGALLNRMPVQSGGYYYYYYQYNHYDTEGRGNERNGGPAGKNRFGARPNGKRRASQPAERRQPAPVDSSTSPN